MSNGQAAHKYLAPVDGLRAVAVLAVIGSHSLGIQMGGYHGVTVFFVISGFLITSMLVNQIQSDGTLGSLQRFYWRRFTRLTPALVVALLLTSTWLVVMGEFRDNIVGLVAAATYTTDLIAYTRLATDVTAYTQWAWSLGIEEQFYIAWPFLLLFLFLKLRSNNAKVLVLVLGAMAIWCWRSIVSLTEPSHERLYYAPDMHVDALLLGCAIGVAYSARARFTGSEVSTLKKILLHLFFYLGCSGLIGLLAFPGAARRLGPVDPEGFGLVAACSAVIVAGLVFLKKTAIHWVLSTRVMVHLGKLSYGLYLFNVLTVEMFGAITGRLPFESRYFAIWIVALLLLTEGCYRLIEKPLRNRLNAWFDRRGGGDATAARTRSKSDRATILYGGKANAKR